ncbi:hypothetical protein MSKU9_3496 [Komagataeibacter diospyri]|uniref:Uncharacterized protein n=1 Tax=Komagataeibacter diospyri TaxID=1932662 RepID=A0A4P5P091_9PROT|nr:hypothetical protein MSKU9_3496 [Komagataeibacter diospyri]
MCFSPSEGRFNNLIQLMISGLPAGVPAELCGIGDQHGRITLSARSPFPGYLAPAHTLNALDNFQITETQPVPDIVGHGSGIEQGQDQDMRVSQIGHMDIVANAGAIMCRIIIAKQLQPRTTPQDAVNCQRDQMCFRLMIFPQPPQRVSACCVEIAQAGATHAMNAVCPYKRPLDKEFAFAIRGAGVDTGIMNDRLRTMVPAEQGCR